MGVVLILSSMIKFVGLFYLRKTDDIDIFNKETTYVITDSVTNLLIPWSKLLEKLIVAQLVRIFPASAEGRASLPSISKHFFSGAVCTGHKYRELR